VIHGGRSIIVGIAVIARKEMKVGKEVRVSEECMADSEVCEIDFVTPVELV